MVKHDPFVRSKAPEYGCHFAFEPEAIGQPFLAAFEPVVTADKGPRLSSSLVTVMEESVHIPGQTAASGPCS